MNGVDIDLIVVDALIFKTEQMSVGQEIAVIPSAVVGFNEIYVQLSSSADKLTELQLNLNQSVTIRSVTKLPSKFKFMQPFSD